MLRAKRFIFHTIFLFILLIAFQNCGPVRFSNILNFAQLSNSNNGGSYGGKPNPPEIVELADSEPLVSQGATPRIRVGEVAIGSIVHIFKDSLCTDEIGANTATSSFAEVMPSVALADGSYTIFATSEVAGLSSDCSTASVNLLVDTVPTLLSVDSKLQFVNEGVANYKFKFNLSLAKPYKQSIRFDLDFSTAIANTHFLLDSRSVTVPANQNFGEIEIDFIDNNLKDGDKVLQINFAGSDSSVVQLTQDSVGQIQILDNEAVFSKVSNFTFGNSDSQSCTVLENGVLKCWGMYPGNGLLNADSPQVVLPGVSFAIASAGMESVCAIAKGPLGEAYCFGKNSYGELGDGTTNERKSPILIGSGWKTISTKNWTTCGIRMDGHLFCWGKNDYGQVGDGTTLQRLLPVAVDPGNTYRDVSTGDTTCAILSTGALKCWGYNSTGAVGNGTVSNQLTPQEIDSGEKFQMVRPSRTMACGLTELGQLKCWGNQFSSQQPKLINPNESFSHLSAASGMVCVVTKDTGIIKCLGIYPGTYGQGAIRPAQSELKPIASEMNFTKVETDGTLSCGITTLGPSLCWRSNFAGMGRAPVFRTVSHEETYAAVAGSCRLKTSGKLTCSGYGDGTPYAKSSTFEVDSSETYRKISGQNSNYGMCGITTNGVLKCWGTNYTGRVGDGTILHRYTPVTIDGANTYLDVSTSFGVTCAIRSDGQLFCWGGQPLGGTGNFSNSKVPVPFDLGKKYAQISVSNHACGVLQDSGELRCWGYNVKGEVGNGTFDYQPVPITIDPGVRYKEVSAVDRHTCGITVSGTLKCWGRNFWNEVGDGTGVNQSSPVVIDKTSIYTSLSQGFAEHTCAILNTGALKCWGDNTSAQVGVDRRTTPSNTPVMVPGLDSVKSVFVLEDSTCVIKNSGGLVCWGNEFNAGLRSILPMSRITNLENDLMQ